MKEPNDESGRPGGRAETAAMQRERAASIQVAFGYDPSDRAQQVVSSIPQALAMMNSCSSILRSAADDDTMLGRYWIKLATTSR